MADYNTLSGKAIRILQSRAGRHSGMVPFTKGQIDPIVEQLRRGNLIEEDEDEDDDEDNDEVINR